MDAVPVTKPACLAVALIALAIGIVYVIARNSQLAYRRVRGLVHTGAIGGAILTDHEVRNYKLVAKFFEKARKPFTKEMAASLIKNGKIAVKGLYSEKSGKNYDATVCLDDTGKYVNYKLEFAPRKKKK